MEIEVKRRRLKSIGLGILAGTFLGMGGMKSAEAINNAWWTDTPETLVTGQIKTTDIEDNETIGTVDNYYIINGNGKLGLNNRENAILTVVDHAERQIEFNFHMDDCKPTSCDICLMKDCPVRSSTFKKKIEWTALNITQPDKHTVDN